MKKLVYILLIMVVSLSALEAKTLGALGHIRPKDGIITLVGAPGVRVKEIRAGINEKVLASDVLVVLDNYERLKRQYDKQVKAIDEAIDNAKSDLEVLNLKIGSALIDMRLKKKELESYESLGGESIAPKEMSRRQAAYDALNIAYEMAVQNEESARTHYEMLEGNREADIALAKDSLDSALIKAEIDGEVLAVLKHEGDDSGGALMQYANLDKIYVDADFYETDLGDIKKGMIAKVSSKALPSELEGEVVSVGKLISADDKTGVVEIALKGSEIASKFLKMEVNVSIDL